MRYYSILFCLMVLVMEVGANDIKHSNDLPTISSMKKRAQAYWKIAAGEVDYLPLTGGTLTGSLYGTSASFSGILHANATGANIRLYADGTGSGDGFVGAGSDGSLYMRNWDGTRGFVIKPSGDVFFQGGRFGIGTSNPSYKLEVVSPSTLGVRLQTSASTIANPQIDLYDAARYQETVISSTDGVTTGTYIASFSNHPLLLGVNHGAADVTLATNGNLGIGTKTPGYIPNATASGSTAKLEVNGNIRINTLSTIASGDIGNLQFLKAHTATTATTYSTAEIRAFTTSGYDGGLRMYTSQHVGGGNYDLRPVMTLNHVGSVGIGTNNPSEKLSVNGNILAKKIIISQSGWPDYVFHPSYSLRPLKEVEKFIQKNKHLPDMPSAKEVEEKGISVGDNQALLLKKIEELTLYLIEVKNENEGLKKRIDKLEKTRHYAKK